MSSWTDSPIVSFGRDGNMVTLGRGPQDYPTLHLHGSEGLGIPPVDIAKADRLTSHGSIVRGVRYTDREVFLPIFLDCADIFELNALRQEWYDLVAPDKGPVEIRVEIPQGGDADPVSRSIFGYYKSGLEGDFGDDYYGDAQRIGLTFDCPDPLWLGPEQTMTLQINPGVKPFLSATEPFFPVILAQSFAKGEWTISVAGDSEVWPTWEVTGPGSDLIIQSGTERIFIQGQFAAGSVTRIQTAPDRMRITPDRWDDLSLDSDQFPLRPGNNTVKVSLADATTATTARLVWREIYRGAI